VTDQHDETDKSSKGVQTSLQCTCRLPVHSRTSLSDSLACRRLHQSNEDDCIKELKLNTNVANSALPAGIATAFIGVDANSVGACSGTDSCSDLMTHAAQNRPHKRVLQSLPVHPALHVHSSGFVHRPFTQPWEQRSKTCMNEKGK
jgi:hypothetical protein